MLKLSLEELSALNLILKFTTVEELIAAAGQGFTTLENSAKAVELSDLCWKIGKTLRD